MPQGLQVLGGGGSVWSRGNTTFKWWVIVGPARISGAVAQQGAYGSESA